MERSAASLPLSQQSNGCQKYCSFLMFTIKCKCNTYFYNGYQHYDCAYMKKPSCRFSPTYVEAAQNTQLKESLGCAEQNPLLEGE